MSDGSEFNGAAIGLWGFLGVFVPLAATGVLFMAGEEVKDNLNQARAVNKLKIFSIFAAATGWLWGPWLGFLLWSIGSMSVNGINYLQRPAQVIPQERQIIDLRNTPPK